MDHDERIIEPKPLPACEHAWGEPDTETTKGQCFALGFLCGIIVAFATVALCGVLQ